MKFSVYKMTLALVFPYRVILPKSMPIFILTDFTLIRKTSGRIRGTFKPNIALSNVGEPWSNSTLKLYGPQKGPCILIVTVA